MSCRLFC